MATVDFCSARRNWRPPYSTESTWSAIVFNNSGYGNVRRDQQDKYQGRLLGVDLHNPDFVKLAESFGVLGLRAGSPESLSAAFWNAHSRPGAPVLIEVSVPPGGESSPWGFLHPSPPG